MIKKPLPSKLAPKHQRKGKEAQNCFETGVYELNKENFNLTNFEGGHKRLFSKKEDLANTRDKTQSSSQKTDTELHEKSPFGSETMRTIGLLTDRNKIIKMENGIVTHLNSSLKEFFYIHEEESSFFDDHELLGSAM